MEDLELLENVSLKKFNTFNIGGFCKYFYSPKNSEELLYGLKKIKENNLKYFIIGGGSNIILPDEDFDGVVISLKKIKKIKVIKNIATIDAGVTLGFMNNSLLKKGYTDFIWASAIPGTLGGALMINAGAHGHDMYENLISIKVIKDDKFSTLKKKDIKYGYRNTNLKDVIIVSATFSVKKGDNFAAVEKMKEWTKERISKQPIDKLNAGSTFKNPVNNYAGKIIEDCGLKSMVVGDAQVSDKHANFIVNNKNATSSEIKELIQIIKAKVKKNHNIDLELENEIVDWNNL